MIHNTLDKIGKALMMFFGTVTALSVIVIAVWIAIPVYIMRKIVQKLS